MRGTKAKLLRRLVAHIDQSDAVAECVTLTGRRKPATWFNIAMGGRMLTCKHNGRRREYQQLKALYKSAMSAS